MGSSLKSSDSSKSLPLLRGTITLKTALADDDDILQKLSYPEQRIDFFTYLYSHSTEIEATVSFHLGVTAKSCTIGEVKDWIAGSFNVCIPVYIDNPAFHPKRRVLIRFPLPYKISETQFPGNADEKLRCEAAAFIWLQQNCAATVPIPHLYGFGFPNGQSFTVPESASLLPRLTWYLWRKVLSALKLAVPCRYIPQPCPHKLGIGYLIMEYIEESNGKMLSESWEALQHDPICRSNLFQDLSGIMLAMAQAPLPRIGSLTIDDAGIIILANRPLTLLIHQLENEGIPTRIGRTLTYPTSEAYALDILSCHDFRLRQKANSIYNIYDGWAQMAALTALRALYPQFLARDLRHGPFYFTLTDLHQSNIFVDDDWHVKCLVDLEWACSLPVEMLHPPYWLTGRGVDQLEKGEPLEAYNRIRSEFMEAFEEKEQLLSTKNREPLFLTNTMMRAWERGDFWYFQSLESPRGLLSIFQQHIQPMFGTSIQESAVFDKIVAPYWAHDAASVIETKIKDKAAYDKRLRDAFED